jgi:acyl-CoA reductase-like NAD-dependent aldehyde dehydrogenase
VLTNVTKGMPAYEEELFGPVASVTRADSENAAIATVNDSAFGLGGGVITGDIARGERIAAEIESGKCVRQRQCPLRSAAAVQRRQAKWLWTRAFALRHQGIRQYQDGCGGLA